MRPTSTRTDPVRYGFGGPVAEAAISSRLAVLSNVRPTRKERLVRDSSPLRPLRRAIQRRSQNFDECTCEILARPPISRASRQSDRDMGSAPADAGRQRHMCRQIDVETGMEVVSLADKQGFPLARRMRAAEQIDPAQGLQRCADEVCLEQLQLIPRPRPFDECGCRLPAPDHAGFSPFPDSRQSSISPSYCHACAARSAMPRKSRSARTR